MLFAYSERKAQTQKELEDQVVITLNQLRSAIGHDDLFSKEDYFRAAEVAITRALKRYPESVELGQKLQNITFERYSDKTISETERDALKDSLAGYYKGLYEKNPKSVTNIYLYARTLEDYEKCLELGNDILKLDKNSYWGYELKAWALFGLKRYGEAEKSLKQAIRIDSTISDAFADLVKLYRETARSEELIQAGLKAYELAPDVNAFYAALSEAKKTNDKESLVKLERLWFQNRAFINYDVLMSTSYDAERLASAYLARGQVDSARLYLDFSYAMSAPRGAKAQGWVLFKQAVLEASQGNKDKAFDLLDRAQKSGLTSYATVSTDTAFSSFENDARFMELLLKMKDAAKEEALSFPLNTPVPDLILVSFEGDTINLSSLKGKPFILDFWPGCCPGVGPYTMKVLEKFQTAHQDIPIYGVGEVYDLQETIALFQEWDVKLPNLISTPEVRDAFGVIGGPYIFIIDSKGNMKYYHVGYSYGEAFEQNLLDKLEWWLEAVK